MPKHRFYYLLQTASHRLGRHAEKVCSEQLGVSAVQLGALFELARRPGCSQRDLAKVLDINESAVTTLVGRLERASVVRRERSSSDARVVLLYATPSGLKIVKRAGPLLRRFNTQLARGFSAEELSTVARFLEQVARLPREGEVG